MKSKLQNLIKSLFQNARVLLTFEEKLWMIIECEIILEWSKEKRHVQHNNVRISECFDEEIKAKKEFFLKILLKFQVTVISVIFCSAR